jgi:hypothetical protein
VGVLVESFLKKLNKFKIMEQPVDWKAEERTSPPKILRDNIVSLFNVKKLYYAVVAGSLIALSGIVVYGIKHAIEQSSKYNQEDIQYCEDLKDEIPASSLDKIIAPITKQYCSNLLK